MKEAPRIAVIGNPERPEIQSFIQPRKDNIIFTSVFSNNGKGNNTHETQLTGVVEHVRREKDRTKFPFYIVVEDPVASLETLKTLLSKDELKTMPLTLLAFNAPDSRIEVDSATRIQITYLSLPHL